MKTLDVLTDESMQNVPKSGYTDKHLDLKKLQTLIEKLTAHYYKHYSANVMKAVVLGPQSLEELEKIARGSLNLIPNRDAKLLRYEDPKFKGPIAKYCQAVKFVPKNSWCFTSICYYIPSLLLKKHKPGKFFIHLLTSNEKFSFKWT